MRLRKQAKIGLNPLRNWKYFLNNITDISKHGDRFISMRRAPIIFLQLSTRMARKAPRNNNYTKPEVDIISLFISDNINIIGFYL